MRIGAVTGAASQAPSATTILGRDYVNANWGSTGVIPAFDYAADKNGDGYLNDAEYAKRAAGAGSSCVFNLAKRSFGSS